MKKLHILTTVLLVSLLFASSCTSDNETSVMPELNSSNITVNSYDVDIYESIEVRFSGHADALVIFTGDATHQYENYALHDSLYHSIGKYAGVMESIVSANPVDGAAFVEVVKGLEVRNQADYSRLLQLGAATADAATIKTLGITKVIYDELADDGFAINKGLFTYAYEMPGTYHVVVVATNYDTFNGNNILRKTYEFDVNVSDDCTTIDQMFTSITPNVFYAEALNDADWVICFPKKQVYNNRELNVNAARARLSINIKSTTSVIYIDGAEYSEKSFYDLTKDHSIRVVAYNGAEKDYYLYSMIYPEFTSVSLEGVQGQLTRSAFSQNLLTYTFTGLSGSTASIAMTLPENTKLLTADDRTINNGDVIDLTGTTAYRLVTVHPDNNKVKAISDLIFQAN